MSEPFIGEIRMLPYQYAPANWAWCDGQQLEVAQFEALFAVILNRYGGNGTSVFKLPDLRERAPLGYGQGRGLSPYQIAEEGGVESVTLGYSEMPAHGHKVYATKGAPVSEGPTAGDSLGAYLNNRVYFRSPVENSLTAMSPSMLADAGGNQPHDNSQPYLVVNFCIALDGVFPPRS